MLGSVKLREAADSLPNDPLVPDAWEENTQGDLYWLADQFEQNPGALDDCAELVIEAAPEVVAYNMGAGPSELVDPFGHVEDVNL